MALLGLLVAALLLVASRAAVDGGERGGSALAPAQQQLPAPRPPAAPRWGDGGRGAVVHALQLWPCAPHGAPGTAHQAFAYSARGGALTLGGRCVGRTGDHTFAALTLGACDQSGAQRWVVGAAGTTTTIRSADPGSDRGCVGVAGLRPAAGGVLQLASNCGAPSRGR